MLCDFLCEPIRPPEVHFFPLRSNGKLTPAKAQGAGLRMYASTGQVVLTFLLPNKIIAEPLLDFFCLNQVETFFLRENLLLPKFRAHLFWL